MHKKHTFGILAICALSFSIAAMGTLYYTNNNSKNEQESNFKFKFTPGGNITFSNLKNSTNFEILGSDPALFPDEFYQIQIIVHFPLFAKWINTSETHLKISNHDIVDRSVYFEATGGTKYIQWVFLNFSQFETDKNASIVWNSKGKINFYGDWIEENQIRSLIIPGRVGQTVFSIDQNFIGISFDQGVTKSQMESTSWQVNIYSSDNANANGFIVTQLFLGLITITAIKYQKNKK